MIAGDSVLAHRVTWFRVLTFGLSSDEVRTETDAAGGVIIRDVGPDVAEVEPPDRLAKSPQAAWRFL
jgi:hypothetical protein